MDKRKQKIYIFTGIYVSLIILLAIIALVGDRNRETYDYALRFFTPEDIKTGRDIFIKGIIPYTIQRLIILGFLLFLALKGWICYRDKKKIYGFFKTVLSLMALLLSFAIIKIPFSIYTSYYRLKEYGLITSEFGTWFSRTLLSYAISIIITALVLGILIWIIKKTKRYLVYIPVAFFII